MGTMPLMKTTRYTVVTETSKSSPMTRGRAEMIARWLREGRVGSRKAGQPVKAWVEVAA